MKPYIEELIRDMNEAEEKASKGMRGCNNQEKAEKTRMDHMLLSYEELFSNPKRIEEIAGIPQAALPPDYLLCNREKAELAKSMESLLNAWGFYPDFPPRVPMQMRYQFLRKIWKSQQVYVGKSTQYIDVCNFEEDSCPFHNHCNMCDQIKEQEKLYNKLKKKPNKNSGN